MVRAYGARVRELTPIDNLMALSRRGLPAPQFRVTRNRAWTEEIDPWKQPERLPLLSGGMLAELLYSDRTWVVDDLQVPDGDPAAPQKNDDATKIAMEPVR